ncbi:hypothetical protein GCM10027426_00640 [Microbacterium lacusdiani]
MRAAHRPYGVVMEALRAAGIDEWSRICSDSFVPLRARGDADFRGAIAHRAHGATPSRWRRDRAGA